MNETDALIMGLGQARLSDRLPRRLFKTVHEDTNRPPHPTMKMPTKYTVYFSEFSNSKNCVDIAAEP